MLKHSASSKDSHKELPMVRLVEFSIKDEMVEIFLSKIKISVSILFFFPASVAYFMFRYPVLYLCLDCAPTTLILLYHNFSVYTPRYTLFTYP